MKVVLLTLLKVIALAWVMWWILHHAPMIVAPIFGVVVLLAGMAATVLLTVTVGATVGLAAVIVLAIVACAIATALAPVWLPLLAMVGFVALCRPKRSRVA